MSQKIDFAAEQGKTLCKDFQYIFVKKRLLFELDRLDTQDITEGNRFLCELKLLPIFVFS